MQLLIQCIYNYLLYLDAVSFMSSVKVLYILGTASHFADLYYSSWSKISTDYPVALFHSIQFSDYILLHCIFVNFKASEDVTNYTVSCEIISVLASCWSKFQTLLKFYWNELFVEILVLGSELTFHWCCGLNFNYCLGWRWFLIHRTPKCIRDHMMNRGQEHVKN